MKKIELSEHFDYKKILLFSLPAIGNMLAITSFQVADGYFVSNLLGVTPFAAVDLVFPVFMVLYAMGFMAGSGGSAIVSRIMGEGDLQHARECFTMCIVFLEGFGLLIGLAAAWLLPVILHLIGADASVFPYCLEYGSILLLCLPVFLINSVFESLWITAGKAWIGFLVSILNGITNVFLDWFFMGPLNLGTRGAALATASAAAASGLVILVYFMKPRKGSVLYFVPFKVRFHEFGHACLNGSSEMVDSVAENITAVIINRQLMHLLGQTAVAAMGVFNYVIGIFMAIFFGLSTTAVTVIGYKLGEGKKEEIRDYLKRNSILSLGFGIFMWLTAFLLARPIAGLFVSYEPDVLDLTVKVLKISSFACILYGFDIFMSSFFTGLGDSLTSIIIAGTLSLAAPIVLIFLLPALFGADAVWYTIPLTTLLSFFVSIACLKWRL